MPFDNETAQAAGRKGGLESAAKRWAGKTQDSIRNKPMRLTITREEFDMIDAKAEAEGISRTELVVRAVRKY